MTKNVSKKTLASKNSSMRGFSLVELIVVVTIALIIAGFAVPSTLQTLHDLELRAGVAQVADLMQQARMLAARKNATYPVQFQVGASGQQAFIDLNQTGTLDPGDPFVNLASSIVAAPGAPSGSGGQPTPYVLVGDSSVGTPYDNTITLAFTPRGLPCNFAACTTPAPTYFVYYFQDLRGNSWAAILVTKAGRSKVLLWNGGSWH